MQRRFFIHTTGFSLASFLIPGNSFLSRMLADPWKITLLRNNVGVFSEKGGTIGFLLTKKGNVVIDTQFPEQSQHLISEMKKLSEKPIDLLINTHHHGDHTSGNISFKGLVSKVVAHENCLANHKRVAASTNTTDKQLFANTTFSTTWKVRCGNEIIKAHYFGAAHTNGDAILHFQHANIAHMGDLIFNRRYAYIDKSAGASIKSWIAVLDKTLATFDNETIFIFGHAFDPLKITGNKEDLKAMQHYLDKLLTYVQDEVKAGKSKEEIMKSTTIPGVTDWQGDGIERGLAAAYEEVTTGK